MSELESSPQVPNLRDLVTLRISTSEQLSDAMIRDELPHAEALGQFISGVQGVDWTQVRNPEGVVRAITDQYRTVFAPTSREEVSYPEPAQVTEWFKGEPDIDPKAAPYIMTIDELVRDSVKRGHHGKDQHLFDTAGTYARYIASHIMNAPADTTFPSDPLALKNP